MPLPLICLSHELSHNVRLLCSVLAILNLGYYRSKQEAGEEDDAVKDPAVKRRTPLLDGQMLDLDHQQLVQR